MITITNITTTTIIIVITITIIIAGAQDLTTESLTTQMFFYAWVLLWKSQIPKTMEWKSLNHTLGSDLEAKLQHRSTAT